MRVLVRRRDERAEALERLGAKVASGNLRDRESLEGRFAGAEAAHFTYPINAGVVEAAAAFASAA